MSQCGSYIDKNIMASKREERRQECILKLCSLSKKTHLNKEIALRIGISNGSAYYCITLIEKGFVKLTNFTQSKNKSNYLYELTPRGIRAKAALTVQFLERKRHEFLDLKTEIEQLEGELGLVDVEFSDQVRSRHEP